MRSKKQLLNDARLYLILDAEVNSYDELFEITESVLSAGVDIIQLRDKNGSEDQITQFSKEILKLTQNRIPYIINDHVKCTIDAQASGVHLGQDDMPIGIARKMMGETAMIGVSCQTLEHVLKAQQDGADYIGFGSVYKTLTKPDRESMDNHLLEEVMRTAKIPIFAIGGIHLENFIQLQYLGVKRIAVCRAICQAQDVSGVVKQFKEGFQGAVVT